MKYNTTSVVTKNSGTDRQTDRQTDSQTVRQADSQTVRQAGLVDGRLVPRHGTACLRHRFGKPE